MNQSKLKVGTVYYYVQDMDRAVKFYTETLGLKLKVRFGNHWAELEAGPITIGLHPTENGQLPAQGGGTVSFRVDDIESLVRDFQDKGITVSDVSSPPRGKFAMLTDSEGNKLHLIEFSKSWVEENKY